LKRNSPIFSSKSSQNCLQATKCQNIYIKAKFESPKHPNQTTFEILKYLQQTMILKGQKIAENVSISLFYFIFSKNHN